MFAQQWVAIPLFEGVPLQRRGRIIKHTLIFSHKGAKTQSFFNQTKSLNFLTTKTPRHGFFCSHPPLERVPLPRRGRIINDSLFLPPRHQDTVLKNQLV
jgi:hypothetical protein